MSSLRDWISENIPEVILEDAASWMALLDSERCHAVDRLGFARWLDEDPRHRWAFEELSEVWAKLRMLNDLRPAPEHPKVRRMPTARLPGEPGPGRAAHRPRADWSALAVSLIVVLAAIVHVLTKAPTQAYTTRAGEIQELRLADGSTLELNALTSLEVRYTARQREVRLLRGEAVFHVAQESRPFIVVTDRGTVAALGTSFVVETMPSLLEVVVIDGTVSVTSSGRDAPLGEYDARAGWLPAGSSTLLDAGEAVRLSSETMQVAATAGGDLDRMLSWRRGVVRFDDQPLGSVVNEMRRYTDLNVHIADTPLASLRVTAEIPADDPAAYIASLERLEGVVVDRADSAWIVLRAETAR
ncbi:MAG: FecR domain-containing protein [Gammaproteobacteria bacterium]|nr:FecR domain-containing protein [Gammaproteobacteria bacterium]MDH4253934.1 FecR domain-containing protein [Gammaproteobacteria bacterium]MDH5310587.1 FecR domain-containing protein [Gammaproteobacteria bacterium]